MPRPIVGPRRLAPRTGSCAFCAIRRKPSIPTPAIRVDMKVMAHKIHMGSELPSVKAGKPYQIIGFGGTVLDWSTVVHPSDARRCESCHAQDTGAAQATAYLTHPTGTPAAPAMTT